MPTKQGKRQIYPKYCLQPNNICFNQDKSVDSWIDKLDSCETSNLNTIVKSQDLTWFHGYCNKIYQGYRYRCLIAHLSHGWSF